MVGLRFRSCSRNVIVFARLLPLLLRASLFKLVIPADIRRLTAASVLRIRNLRRVGISSLGLRLFLRGFYFWRGSIKSPYRCANKVKTGRKYIFKGLGGDF